MNFILNPEPLPLGGGVKKSESIQYYQWKHKQKLQQEEQQQKKLKLFLQSIEKIEQQEQKIHCVKKKGASYDNFYERNQKWKKGVQGKINQMKDVQNKQLQRKQQNAKKVQHKEDRKEMVRFHQGPISGWQEHFQNYLKKKTVGLTTIPEQVTFQPKINDKSKKLTEGLEGPVEDRLILFGEFLKMRIKTQQIQDRMPPQTSIYSFSNTKTTQKYSSSSLSQSLFERLYRQGQKIQKKKKQTVLDDRHTFHPKTNKLPQEIQERIMQKRKPLYYLKPQNNQNTKCLEDTTHRTVKSDFEGFMKRNQALIEMKKKMAVTLKERQEEKENLQKSQCTFTPVLNHNSMKIHKTMKSVCSVDEKMLNQIKSQLIESCIHKNEGQNVSMQKLAISQLKSNPDENSSEQDSLSFHKTTNFIERGCQNTKKPINFSTGRTRPSQMMEANISRVDEPISDGVEDSIDQMKSYQWQNQLQQIQNTIQNMMSRVTR